MHYFACVLNLAPVSNVSEATLLAIAKHFNHPVFANIGWVDQAPGKTYNESLPCGAPGVQSTWDYVLCLNGYVQSM